jgi:hypothetical protein
VAEHTNLTMQAARFTSIQESDVLGCRYVVMLTPINARVKGVPFTCDAAAHATK